MFKLLGLVKSYRHHCNHHCSLLLAALFGSTYIKGVALQSWSLVAGMVVV